MVAYSSLIWKSPKKMSLKMLCWYPVLFRKQKIWNMTLKSSPCTLTFPGCISVSFIIQGGAVWVKSSEIWVQQLFCSCIDFLKPGNRGQIHPSGCYQTFHFKSSQCYLMLSADRGRRHLIHFEAPQKICSLHHQGSHCTVNMPLFCWWKK